MTNTDPSADPAAIEARRRESRRSYFRWLPKGFLLGIVLTAVIGAVTYPVLESRARQALGQATMMSATSFDWSRIREAGWKAYAIPVAFLVAISFAVVYIMPQ